MLSLAALFLASTAAAAQTQPSPADLAKQEKAKALLAQAAVAEKKGDQAKKFALIEEAVQIFRNPEALHQLGHMYDAATTFPNAHSRALHWYAEAGEQGHGESLAHLTKALEASNQLSDDDFATVASALAKGSRKGYAPAAIDMADRIQKQQVAARKCAADYAQRLGYVADETSDRFMGTQNYWYAVRTGSGANSRGDKLSIFGTKDDNGAFGMYRVSRLSINVSGFTGIKLSSIAAGEGRSFQTKDYTGYTERGSAQGDRDAATILKACKIT